MGPILQQPVQHPGPTAQPVPRARAHAAHKVGKAVAEAAQLEGGRAAQRVGGGVPVRVHSEAQRHHHSG